MFTYTLFDEKGKAKDHGTENSIVNGIGISTSIQSGAVIVMTVVSMYPRHKMY